MAIRAEDMWQSSLKSRGDFQRDGAAGRLSDRLLLASEGVWQEAMEKQFLREMADGTLRPERFRYYMIIDDLYLIEYIKTLRIIEERSAEPEIRRFLQDTIEATEEELRRVHIPNMVQLGITEKEIAETSVPKKVKDYILYMRGLALERPVLESLTALLDCSWAYAYIADQMVGRYGEKIRKSPYRDWFTAYTSREYTDSNRAWIDMVDSLADSPDEERQEELCRIFVTCAGYENDFWDAVYCGEA